MRLRILRRVLLPAPFRPMMPMTSPCLTSKLTSLSAQNSSISSPWTTGMPRSMSAALRAYGLSLSAHSQASEDPISFCLESGCSPVLARGNRGGARFAEAAAPQAGKIHTPVDTTQHQHLLAQR